MCLIRGWFLSWVLVLVSCESEQALSPKAAAPSARASQGQTPPSAPSFEEAVVQQGKLVCPDGLRRMNEVLDEGIRDSCVDEQGRRQGPWLMWSLQGQRQTTGFFLDDQLHGPWKAWWENGVLKAEGEFEHGEQSGKWRFFSPEGEEM
ncbi:MAG: hypothetical protein RBU37_08215 [Myxococcota bacterium]|jgi:hypothetical protein|nr:hypothetical protein [Myxococcota bacterium]